MKTCELVLDIKIDKERLWGMIEKDITRILNANIEKCIITKLITKDIVESEIGKTINTEIRQSFNKQEFIDLLYEWDLIRWNTIEEAPKNGFYGILYNKIRELFK